MRTEREYGATSLSPWLQMAVRSLTEGMLQSLSRRQLRLHRLRLVPGILPAFDAFLVPVNVGVAVKDGAPGGIPAARSNRDGRTPPAALPGCRRSASAASRGTRHRAAEKARPHPRPAATRCPEACVGLAQGALDEAISYAKERRAFGQPIGKFQAIQAKIADISAQIEASRLLVYRAAVLKERGEPFTLTAAQAKLITGRLAGPRHRGGGPDPRRLRLHRGVPGLPLLPRRQDPHDRRGHRRGAADGDRPPAGLLSRYDSAGTAEISSGFGELGDRALPFADAPVGAELALLLGGEGLVRA